MAEGISQSTMAGYWWKKKLIRDVIVAVIDRDAYAPHSCPGRTREGAKVTIVKHEQQKTCFVLTVRACIVTDMVHDR